MSATASRSLIIAGAVAAVVVLGSIGVERGPARPTASRHTPGAASRADDILGRHNPYDDLPKMNTPQQFLNDAAERALAAAGDCIGKAIAAGSRDYYYGRDPSLNLLLDSRLGNVEQMKVWLKDEADPNIPDPHKHGDMDTALICAVRSGNPEAVELLLPRMSREGKQLRNRERSTALTIARGMRNHAATLEEGERMRAIEQVLEKAGVPE